MKNKIVLLILANCFFGLFHLSAQIKQANFFFGQFKYSKAIPLYKKVIDGKDEKVKKEATIRLADCYRLMNNDKEARSWYAKAITYQGIGSINYYYLGMALRTLANYDEAEKAFNSYVEKAPSDFRGKIYAHYCRDIIPWLEYEPSAEIKNATGLNSQYSDFGPIYYKDDLIFTSDRDIDMMNDKNYLWTSFGYLDLYESQPNYHKDFWSEMYNPTKLPNTFNQPYHDGPASFTQDYKTIFTTRTLKNSSKKDSTNLVTDLLKIFYADLSDEKKVIYKPFPYNSEDYSVGHPAISKDGKKLYFSSNKPGGYGLSDLYSSELIDGKWSEPVNLGPEINTFGNEVFPFLANDSTLFFSSDGLLGYGGLDVFQTDLVDGKWSTPWNLKLPLNSPYDDFSVIFNKDITEGFISSNRPGGMGSDDIYAFRLYKRTPPSGTPPLAVTKAINSNTPIKTKPDKFNPLNETTKSPVISGYVKDKTTMAPLDSATVFLLNTFTNEVLVLKTNTEGYFESPVTKGVLYIAKGMMPDFFDDCLNFRIFPEDPSVTLKTPRDLLLDKYALNKVFKIENIYYDLDKWFIREDAKPPLDDLVRIMKQYPISVELGSHTDSRATFEYNIELSQKRAEAAVRYLTFNGINPMRMTAKGYGETMLGNKCADGVPCTEVEHQANRRTEFKITAINASETGKKTFNPNVFKAGDKIPVQLLDAEFFNGCLDNKNTDEIASPSQKTVPLKEKMPAEPVKKQIIQEEVKKPVTTVVAKKEESTTQLVSNPFGNDMVSFAVQLAASTKPIKVESVNFKGESFVQEKKIGVYYKYFSTAYVTFSQAMEERKRLLTKFPGAFVVAFKGEQPISIEEARKRL